MLAKKDIELIRSDLSRYDQVREQILSLSREAVRLCGSSILEIHRGDLKQAGLTIQKVERALSRIDELCNDFVEFRSSQSVTLARQEFVEALTLQKYVQDQRVPTLKDVGNEPRSYMLGLLDAIGEFRRMTLNSLRRGDVEAAERILELMEGIYEDLQGLDHTSIIPTFRVKMDSSRRIIETTRGDVVTEVRRFSLEKALGQLSKRLGSSSKS